MVPTTKGVMKEFRKTVCEQCPTLKFLTNKMNRRSKTTGDIDPRDPYVDQTLALKWLRCQTPSVMG